MNEITDIIEHINGFKQTDLRKISSGINSWEEEARIEKDIIDSSATHIYSGFVLGRNKENTEIYLCSKFAKLGGDNTGRYVTTEPVKSIQIKDIIKYEI